MANTVTSSTSAKGTKFKVEQKVAGGSARRGSYAIERTVDPNSVVIKRRFGEGSKPLFERDDISINRGVSSDKCSPVHSKSKSANYRSRKRSSSRESNSAKRYPRNTRTVHSGSSTINSNTTRSSTRNRPSARSPPPAATSSSSKRNATSEKVPYFLDDKREKDRLRRRYGDLTPPSSSTAKRKSERNRSKSRSRTPLAKQSLTTTHLVTRHHYCLIGGHEKTSRTGRRSPRSRERNTRERRSLSGGRPANSASSSGSQSRQGRRRRSNSHENNRSTDEHEARAVPATQIITIPVPVPDYPYAYPSWPPQHAWGAPALPPPRFAPYHPMGPMLPGSVMPPLRPPPLIYGMPPYNVRMFRPQQQRYNFRHYATRSNRPNYRPRNA